MSAATRPDWSERLLALAGGASDDPDARLVSFARALLLYSSARAWIAVLRVDGAEAGLLVALALAVSASAGLAFAARREWQRLAPRAALVPLAIHLVWSFPTTDNHFFLELVLVLVLAAFDGATALRTLRFALVIVLFHTGLQKLLWGHYLHGDFLAFMIATGSPFGDLFGLVLPAAEIERLQGLRILVDGAGPYRVEGRDSIWLRLASNAVVVAELVLPFLLIAKPTRTVAAAITLALVLSLQLGARELLFLSLFATGLCLFLPKDPLPRALPWLALGYGVLFGLAAGVIPDGGFLRGGHL
ncbi:MAG: hypothetical protein QNK05_10760 [Myxococcota bacterium]|nr:hypothetical protein [Myxococcota bacterium]